MIEGMSAAKAAVDNNAATPAPAIDFTLRIGFVPCSCEATEQPHF
jgi:hypothetical protein